MPNSASAARPSTDFSEVRRPEIEIDFFDVCVGTHLIYWLRREAGTQHPVAAKCVERGFVKRIRVSCMRSAPSLY